MTVLTNCIGFRPTEHCWLRPFTRKLAQEEQDAVD